MTADSQHDDRGPEVPAPESPSRKAPQDLASPTLQEGNAMFDILGPQEVAALLGVEPNTVRKWRSAGLMPEPDRVISRVPIWTAQAIILWAVKTGRLEMEAVT